MNAYFVLPFNGSQKPVKMLIQPRKKKDYAALLFIYDKEAWTKCFGCLFVYQSLVKTTTNAY